MVYPSTSRAGNLIVNPSGTDPGLLETTMRCPAWWLLDMSPFWGFPGLIGGNDHIPGTTGQLPYAQDVDQGVYVAPLQVCGDVNVTGGSAPSGYSGAVQQLKDNLGWLWDNVFSPAPSGVPYRDAILVEPDGTEIACKLQPKGQLGRTLSSEAWIATEWVAPSGRIE